MEKIKKEKKQIKVYSLMSVSNGHILSATVRNTGHLKHAAKDCNYTIGQFNTASLDTLNHFIDDLPDERKQNQYFMKYGYGFQQVWVKETEIEDLYLIIASSIINNFSTYTSKKAKENQVFGAFLFSLGIETFLNADISTLVQMGSFLRKKKLAKEFLLFLDTNGILGFLGTSYTHINKIIKFSFAEIDLVERQIEDVEKTWPFMEFK